MLTKKAKNLLAPRMARLMPPSQMRWFVVCPVLPKTSEIAWNLENLNPIKDFEEDSFVLSHVKSLGSCLELLVAHSWRLWHAGLQGGHPEYQTAEADEAAKTIIRP